MSQSNDRGLNLDHLEALPPFKVSRFSDTNHRGVLVIFDRKLSDTELNTVRAALANQPAPTDWQAAHADMVKRNALLRERPDLPADRIPAHAELVRLQEENARLRANQPAPTVPAVSTTDCRSPEGVATGLIDGVIAIARALRSMDQSHSAVIEALKDIRSDEDVAALLAHQPAQEQASTTRVTETKRAQQEPVAATGSIGDLTEFHVLLNWYDNEASYGSINEGRNKLTEYIDKWADRRAAQLDGGQEGSAT